MSGFLSSMVDEIGARRTRLRAAFGDRGQAVTEFLVLGGLAIGSIGLVVRDGMVRTAPWGLALPFVFVIGYLLIDARRQRAVPDFKRRLPEINDDLDAKDLKRTLTELRAEQDVDAEDLSRAEAEFRANTEARRLARLDQADTIVGRAYDWPVFLWSFGCALLGAAAFVLAWTAQPHVAPHEEWQPPREAVDVDIAP
jgi:hypothetical protein